MFCVSIFFIGLIRAIIENDAKCKMWAFSISGSDTNLAIEAFDDIFWDNKAETDSLSVHSLSVRHFAEQFEKFTTIFKRYSDASVYYRDNQFVFLF